MILTKVCFFSGDITRNGGTERVSAMIANQLVQDPQYQVCFLSLVEQKPAPFYELDQRIWRAALGKKWLNPGPEYLPLIPKLRAFLKQNEIDVLIDIDIVLDVLSVPASCGLRTKVISWEHSNCEYELSQGYRRVIVKLFTKRTDWIVTLTPGDAESFRKLMGRQERITAIFNPIAATEEKEKKPDRENNIVTVARLVQGKGFDLLVQVAEKILPGHPDWKWYICGDGPEREMLEQFRTEKGLTGQIRLEGLVPRVEDYLERSKLFVLTSRAEGLPMCLLEARTQGVPCVSFDIPTGPADIIEDGVNGCLIPPLDCDEMARRINALLDDPAALEQMGRKASEGLEPFSMERVIGQWKETIGKLVE